MNRYLGRSSGGLAGAFRLYGKFFSIHLRSAMEYKTSFFLTILGQFFTSFSVFLEIYFMMSRFHKVDGFSFNDILLCYAVVLMGFTLAEIFFRGFDTFPSMISNGSFDRALLRPRNEVFLVLASRIEFSRLGRLIQAVVIFCFAIPNSQVSWTALKVFVLFLMCLGGAVYFSALFLTYATFSFFTLEGLEFMNIFTDGGREHGKYPMSVYGREVLWLATWILPLACVQYYPLLYLLGRSSQLLYAFAPVSSFVFLIPCWLFWKFGLRHYRSTGS